MILGHLLSAVIAGFSLSASMATATTLSVDFSTYATSNLSVVDFLHGHDLRITTYTIAPEIYRRAFARDNVFIQDGYLTMTVPGGTPPGGDVSCAGIRTVDNKILHGTFKTVAITAPVQGVYHGFFTHTDDSQETDIVTNDHSRNAHMAVHWPADPTQAEHEYQIERSEHGTKQFFDGKLIATLETNMPSVPSDFVWNSCLAGSRTEDATLKIKSIELEYENA